MMKRILPLLVAVALFLAPLYSTDAAARPHPAIPTGLSGHALSSDQIQLTWKSVQGADGYAVYYKSETGYALLGTTKRTSYADTYDLKPFTVYTYRVRAYTGSGSARSYSSYSLAMSVRTLDRAPVCTLTDLSVTSCKLSWEPSEVSGTQIYRSNSSSGSFKLLTETAANEYTDTQLDALSTYYYKLRTWRMIDGQKVYSDFTNVLRTYAPLNPPDIVVSESLTSEVVGLHWDSVFEAAGYIIWRADSPKGPYKKIKTLTRSSYADTGLQPGHSYYYKVQSYRVKNFNILIPGDFSSPVSSTTLKKGQKKLNIAFIGNSYFRNSQLCEMFQSIANSQKKKLSAYLVWKGGYSLSQHISDIRSGEHDDILNYMDIVLMHEAGGAENPTCASTVKELMSLFPKTKQFYYVPVSCNNIKTQKDVLSEELHGVPNIKNIKNNFAFFYLLQRFDPSQFHYEGDGHYHALYGYMAAATAYTTLFGGDATKLPHSFLDESLIPGITQEDKDKNILWIKQMVNKAVLLKE